MHHLVERLEDCSPDTFPYSDVVDEYHRVGKHFVAEQLLGALDAIRNRASGPPGPGRDLLDRFLDCALDKWDSRYDYPTYTALNLLSMPAGDDPDGAPRRRDRLVVLLVTDALRFEHAAADGRTGLLPRMRPDERTVAKRCRLGLRAIRPEPERLGLTDEAVAVDPVAASREVCEVVRARLTPDERRMLELSMLPVDIVHDEYLFIRVLQSFEATFALLTVQLRTAVERLNGGAARPAADCLTGAETALHRSAPLFSLLATMQVASFRLFRQFTEGASAIQSRNYKAFEALCRRPDDERLDSPAYRSVPEVRRQVLDGVPNLDTTLRAAYDGGRITTAERDEVLAAMDRFGAVLAQWRKTHYRLAVRMLGERPGTGYTQGTPYLRQVLDIPVFRSTTGGTS